MGLLTLPCFTGHIAAKDFVVVIDAGHGGHDPGAIGKISKEKNINLSVALKVGNLIKNNCNDAKVIYTRDRDVFVNLNRRAEIANNAKADLFISIHTNALEKNKTMQGASTWTLGLAKSDANLEVAKRENSVILYEDDYKSRYAGFNPNSSESYIIFEFMQDKYMSQSVHLASLIQKQFKNTSNRIDRGVHQAGFLVLKASSMPSVLVELGFISTPEEERYLNTDKGVNALAKSVFLAFLQYKNEHQNRLAGNAKIATAQQIEEITIIEPEDTEEGIINVVEESVKTNTKPEINANSQYNTQNNRTVTPSNTIRSNDEIIFKIQILTSSSVLNKNNKQIKGLKGVDYYREDGLYKYTYSATSNYNEALRIRKSIAANFKDAFIIAFKNGKKMNINAAIVEFKQKKNNNKEKR